MTDEQLEEIFESTSADVPDAHLIFGRAVAQAERVRVADLIALTTLRKRTLYAMQNGEAVKACHLAEMIRSVK